MKSISKKEILKVFLLTLKNRKELLEKSRQKAQEDANEAESAMQTRYGSAKEENQALAQAFQAAVIKTDSEIVITKRFIDIGFKKKDTISNGSFIKLNMSGKERYVFLFNFGADKVKVDDHEILIISSEAPLSVLLYGKKNGDKVILPNGNKVEILSFE